MSPSFLWYFGYTEAWQFPLNNCVQKAHTYRSVLAVGQSSQPDYQNQCDQHIDTFSLDYLFQPTFAQKGRRPPQTNTTEMKVSHLSP